MKHELEIGCRVEVTPHGSQRDWRYSMGDTGSIVDRDHYTGQFIVEFDRDRITWCVSSYDVECICYN